MKKIRQIFFAIITYYCLKKELSMLKFWKVMYELKYTEFLKYPLKSNSVLITFGELEFWIQDFFNEEYSKTKQRQSYKISAWPI